MKGKRGPRPLLLDDDDEQQQEVALLLSGARLKGVHGDLKATMKLVLGLKDGADTVWLPEEARPGLMFMVREATGLELQFEAAIAIDSVTGPWLLDTVTTEIFVQISDTEPELPRADLMVDVDRSLM